MDIIVPIVAIVVCVCVCACAPQQCTHYIYLYECIVSFVYMRVTLCAMNRRI